MKKFTVLPLVAALAFFVSCQKQQTEEEKRAEVERQVQERLATERQAEEQQRLAQQQADLEAREKALANKEAASTTSPSAEEEPSETTESTTQTTRRSRDTSETRSTASYGTFYRKLEPYGAWRETSDYGFVWQPREAEESRNWRPYTEGRWVYSDAGWTWVSDEPFGWATYHYGRWTRLRGVGWVWVPGEEWAPAWVSWRTSNDYVGWAPLPPEARFDRRRGIQNWADNYYEIGPDQYSFVRGSDFGSEQVRRAVISSERNVTIVNETTNVTNITYANTTVVNQGPNYDEMRARSQRPIERYRLRRQREMSGDTARATVRGDEIEVTVPEIGAEPGMDRPRNVRERVAQVVVDKGWSEISDRSAAEKARAKMRTESTPPPDAPSKTFVKPDSTATASAAPASPTATAAAPAATATPAATAPAATVSPTVRSRTTPTGTPAASAAPSADVSPAASARPPATATPVPSVSVSPSVTPRPAATATPLPSVSPTVSVRPTASPALATSPAASASPAPSVPPLRVVTPPPTPASTASPAPQAEEPSGSPESRFNSAAQRAEREHKLEEIRKRRALPPGAVAPGISASPAAVSDAAPADAPAAAETPPRRIPPTANPSPSIATGTPAAKDAAKPLPVYKPGGRPAAPDRNAPPAAASKPAATAPALPSAAGARVPPAAATTSPVTSPTATPTPTASAAAE